MQDDFLLHTLKLDRISVRYTGFEVYGEAIRTFKILLSVIILLVSAVEGYMLSGFPLYSVSKATF